MLVKTCTYHAQYHEETYNQNWLIHKIICVADILIQKQLNPYTHTNSLKKTFL